MKKAPIGSLVLIPPGPYDTLSVSKLTIQPMIRRRNSGLPSQSKSRLPFQDRYISLDGHTRLYYAVMQGWESVRAVTEASDEWVYRFVEEARKRNIHTPMDLIPVSHDEYTEKWDRFCDAFFAEGENISAVANPENHTSQGITCPGR